MASDDRLNTKHILELISDVDNHLSEVKHLVSLFDNDAYRLRTDVDASCLKLSFIKETFTKPNELGNCVCIALDHLRTQVKNVVEEIEKASDRSNPAEMIQTPQKDLRNDIAGLKGPSFQEGSSGVSQPTRRTTDIVNQVGPSRKSLSLNNPGLNQFSFDSENSPELIGSLDSRSRQFLLFFSVFPRDAVVNKRVLKNWWIGEGLLGSSFVQAEITANKILEELMVKGFIEALREQSRLVGFKLRPYVHQLVLSLASYYGFFALDAKGNPSIELSISSRAYLVKTKEQSSIDELKEAQDVENIGTLFNINEQYPDFKPEIFSKLKNIKVLSLGKWQRDDNHNRELERYKIFKVTDLENSYHHIELENINFLKGLKKTRSLRLLSLRGISRIKELPESLCMQVDLRILDLNSCYNLEELPNKIGTFKKLTYLDVSGCYLLDRMPKGIAALTELHVLKGFLVVNMEDSCTFLELSELTKLRKLSLYTHRDNFPTPEELVIFQKFKELQNLSIIWGKTVKRHTLKDGPLTNKASITSDAKDDKKEDAGAAFKLGNQRTREDVVALGKEKKTMNVKGNKEECCIADQQNADGRIHEEEAAGTIHTEVAGDILKQEATASSTIPYLFGAGANKDVSIKTSAITKPILQGLSKMTTIRPEREKEAKSSEEIFRSLEKLDIQCYPLEKAPDWLKADNMKNLKKLYIRGGKLKDWFTIQSSQRWNIEILRLKFLCNLTLDWGHLRASFPKLIAAEKVECPNIKSFPKKDGMWLAGKETWGSHQ